MSKKPKTKKRSNPPRSTHTRQCAYSTCTNTDNPIWVTTRRQAKRFCSEEHAAIWLLADIYGYGHTFELLRATIHAFVQQERDRAPH